MALAPAEELSNPVVYAAATVAEALEDAVTMTGKEID